MLPQRFQDAIRLILDRSLVPSIGDVRLVPAGSPSRPGWRIWDASVVSRNEFAELYRVIGDRYGAGDGVSTFQIGPVLEFWDQPVGTEFQIRVR